MHASLVKRFIALGAVLLSAILATGCPVYSDTAPYGSAGCRFATDCPNGYRCTASGYCVPAPPIGPTGRTDAGQSDGPASDAPVDVLPGDTFSGDDGTAVTFCGNPSDCFADETCGTDGTCHRGDCSTISCINQFQCAVSITTPSGLACVHADSRGCGSDRECARSSRCVDGRCIPLGELCTDRSQCAPGHACVEGKCIATCEMDSQCPTGFLCSTQVPVCNLQEAQCTGTLDCGRKDRVCVDGACVPRCGAAGVCGDGGAGICVDNGCVPSQKPRVTCQIDGSSCGAGQICVHQSCYTSCQAPNAGACAALAATPLCKTVTVGTTSYAICGTTQTLGSECDPTADKPCSLAAQTCVDGFCR